jgi:hypothetical protein
VRKRSDPEFRFRRHRRTSVPDTASAAAVVAIAHLGNSFVITTAAAAAAATATDADTAVTVSRADRKESRPVCCRRYRDERRHREFCCFH